MRSTDIPYSAPFIRTGFDFGDLLKRTRLGGRSPWLDIPAMPGIYIVYWRAVNAPEFSIGPGLAIHATPTSPAYLSRKWKACCARVPTDILYIGKGTDLRRRVCNLIRFGVGKYARHHGGEWLWQIQKIESAGLLVQTCEAGKQIAFESWLLERFRIEHGDFPLANRKGPQGAERWHPDVQPAI
jgi:hypothetical protein